MLEVHLALDTMLCPGIRLTCGRTDIQPDPHQQKSFAEALAASPAMLEYLSHLAAEHSKGRTETGSESPVDSEDEDMEETASCSRIGLFIGYLLPTWGHASLANAP